MQVFDFISQASKQGAATMQLPREALQMLDTIMAWVSCNDPESIAAGRSFYFYDPNNAQLGGGTEAWSGYTQAMRATQVCVGMGTGICMEVSGHAHHYLYAQLGYTQSRATHKADPLLFFSGDGLDTGGEQVWLSTRRLDSQHFLAKSMV